MHRREIEQKDWQRLVHAIKDANRVIISVNDAGKLETSLYRSWHKSYKEAMIAISNVTGDMRHRVKGPEDEPSSIADSGAEMPKQNISEEKPANLSDPYLNSDYINDDRLILHCERCAREINGERVQVPGESGSALAVIDQEKLRFPFDISMFSSINPQRQSPIYLLRQDDIPGGFICMKGRHRPWGHDATDEEVTKMKKQGGPGRLFTNKGWINVFDIIEQNIEEEPDAENISLHKYQNEVIEDVVEQSPARKKQNFEENFMCEWCGTSFKSRMGLIGHYKGCKSRKKAK